MAIIHKVIEEIHQGKNFLLTTHRSPDGDGVGSALALGFALQSSGKTLQVINQDPFPHILDFLPGQDLFRQAGQISESCDALIVLDCGDLSRTGYVDQYAVPAKRIINIDHHITNRNFGHVNWVQTDAIATGEMVYDLIRTLAIPITEDMAVCIYTSIVTETGFFRYSNTTDRTFQMASELVGYGVKPWWVAEQLLERNRVARLKLLGGVLNQINLSQDGRFAWIEVLQDQFSETETTAEDTDNFVNYPRSIQGVEVAVFFRELDSSQCKISFRSKGRVDVARLAEQFDGGGHHNASGCVVSGNLHEVKDKVLPVVQKAVKMQAL